MKENPFWNKILQLSIAMKDLIEYDIFTRNTIDIKIEYSQQG